MNKQKPLLVDIEIPGVKPADQERSRLLQQRFVVAGRSVLQHIRLIDLSIPALAKEAGSSVGGFYSRFESKDAFFEFMRMQMLQEHIEMFQEYLDASKFNGTSHLDISTAFIDFMITVFSGPWRGVLREAYSQIRDRPEAWEPMKQRGQFWRERITEMNRPLVDNQEGLEERVSVAVQLLFSALNNEMMNPNLVFRINDPKFRFYLISSFDSLIAGDNCL